MACMVKRKEKSQQLTAQQLGRFVGLYDGCYRYRAVVPRRRARESVQVRTFAKPVAAVVMVAVLAGKGARVTLCYEHGTVELDIGPGRRAVTSAVQRGHLARLLGDNESALLELFGHNLQADLTA
jgi:hypothetical protein